MRSTWSPAEADHRAGCADRLRGPPGLGASESREPDPAEVDEQVLSCRRENADASGRLGPRPMPGSGVRPWLRPGPPGRRRHEPDRMVADERLQLPGTRAGCRAERATDRLRER